MIINIKMDIPNGFIYHNNTECHFRFSIALCMYFYQIVIGLFISAEGL